MSTTTNLHDLDTISVTSFDADDNHGPFVSVRFTDVNGNSVTLFPKHLDQFVANLVAAATNPRTAS